MTGGVSSGGAALILWAAVAVPAAVAGGVAIDRAAARWRAYLPAWWRELGYPLEGDRVECPDCGVTAEAEAWPDPFGVDGMALCCGHCGEALDCGHGMRRLPEVYR